MYQIDLDIIGKEKLKQGKNIFHFIKVTYLLDVELRGLQPLLAA